MLCLPKGAQQKNTFCVPGTSIEVQNTHAPLRIHKKKGKKMEIAPLCGLKNTKCELWNNIGSMSLLHFHYPCRRFLPTSIYFQGFVVLFAHARVLSTGTPKNAQKVRMGTSRVKGDEPQGSVPQTNFTLSPI